MQAKTLQYHIDGVDCVSKLFLHSQPKRPTIMIVPAFDGMTEFFHDYAAKVVAAGFNALLVDMYGDSKALDDFDACVAEIQPFFADRSKTALRMNAALEALKTQPEIDSSQVAAIGFCFGGMCALDLARAGADIKAAVSFHGVLTAPEHSTDAKITAKVLLLHGYEDSSVPPEQLHDIGKEMTEKNVDWQFVFFGNTKHSFTEPGSENFGPKNGPRQYNADSARRAWTYCQHLLHEVFE